MFQALLLLTNITLVFLIFLTLLNVFKAVKGKNINGYVFFLPVFLVFYILPLITDDVFNLSFNPNYYHILEAVNNIKVNIYYNIYYIIVLILFNLHFIHLSKNKKNNLVIDYNKIIASSLMYYNRMKVILWLIVIFPIFYIFFKGIDQYYLLYFGRYAHHHLIPPYHSFITKLIFLNVFICTFIITVLFIKNKLCGRKKFFSIILIIVVLILSFWIHGKRSIVATYFAIQIILLLIMNVISFKKLPVTIGLMAILFVGFFIKYDKGISNTFEETYYTTRTDFSRDYGVKFAIYNDILKERHIIPNKLDTFKFNVLFYIPRKVWPEKPQPYAVYFTNSAFGNFGEDYLYGWGLTTSIFAEFISNIGIFGLILAPLLLMWILNREVKSTNPLFKLISIILSILLLILQPIAFMPLIIVYIFLIIKGNKRIRFA